MGSLIKIPQGAQEIISRLTSNGYKAYVVGGCVRDSIRKVPPHDWDICTSATPDQVKACIQADTIDTGIRHGTITVKASDGNYEVTTFRVDGDYSDGRRPDSVSFTTDVTEDLARRDFTMNAIAYNDIDGLIDPFEGGFHILSELIHCVGDPDERFREDSLRVMRALRFSATLGFKISHPTAAAAKRNAASVRNVSAERIYSELTQIVCGKYGGDVLLKYPEIFCEIIPELKSCYGFDQNSKFHQYTVYDHIAHAVSNYTGDDACIKYALLFHDIGKPLCYTEDQNGGHFKGHNLCSYDLARNIMTRLKFDSNTFDEVSLLVLHHDAIIDPEPKVVRRWLRRIGEPSFRRLIEVRIADIMAHANGTYEERLDRAYRLKAILEEVISEDQCFSLKNLKVSGYDLIELGIPQGKAIGNILDILLTRVIDGELENNRDILLDAARGLAKQE